MKGIFLKISAAAAGVTLALCIAAATVVWYTSRPKPPKPWDTNALVVVGPPGFGSYPDTDYHFYLTYSVRNTTLRDWSLESSSNLRLVSQLGDGSLSNPISNENVRVRTPTFIPANQTGTITLHFMAGEYPKQLNTESSEAFHERLRKQLNEAYPSMKGFVLFDDANRIQVDLTTWARKKPENAGEISSDRRNP
jgi:hypothetical protein